jgi:hypothetical protein
MLGQEFQGALAGELASFWVESVGAAGIVEAMLGAGIHVDRNGRLRSPV